MWVVAGIGEFDRIAYNDVGLSGSVWISFVVGCGDIGVDAGGSALALFFLFFLLLDMPCLGFLGWRFLGLIHSVRSPLLANLTFDPFGRLLAITVRDDLPLLAEVAGLVGR